MSKEKKQHLGFLHKKISLHHALIDRLLNVEVFCNEVYACIESDTSINDEVTCKIIEKLFSDIREKRLSNEFKQDFIRVEGIERWKIFKRDYYTIKKAYNHYINIKSHFDKQN